MLLGDAKDDGVGLGRRLGPVHLDAVALAVGFELLQQFRQAREATLAITLDVPEDTDIYMPMVSRLAQLTVIDVLATGFTLRRGAKFRDNLKRVKEALKESRFDKELLIKSDVP